MPMLTTTFLGAPAGFKIECYKPKSTKKHTLNRPKKTNPSDKNRKPAEYDRSDLPAPPPFFTVTKPAN